MSVVSLGTVAKVFSSKRIFASEYVDYGIPFLRGKEVIEKHMGKPLSSSLYISESRYEELKKLPNCPIKNDILLTSVGTLGVPWLVDQEHFYYKDGNITCIRANQNLLNPSFLYYWLCSPFAREQINYYQIGSTQKALTINNIEQFKIDLPPLEYQIEVVNFFRALDNKIKLNQKINDYLIEF